MEYLQAHSIDENSNSTERHFVVTCLLFCLPCWMDIAVWIQNMLRRAMMQENTNTPWSGKSMILLVDWLGSLEDTFTQVYVYDLKETHHYDHHNTFWDRSRHLQNNNSRCLKQFYDSLNDEYQKTYSGTRRSLGSWMVLPSFFFSFLTY